MKGADSVIFERLAETNQRYLKTNKEWITKFSRIGLRTLGYCVKVYTEKELSDIMNKFYDAENSEKDVDELLIKVEDDVEQGFMYVGSTAVEDKLQDDVPECIADFLKADIKLWMLTGDK